MKISVSKNLLSLMAKRNVSVKQLAEKANIPASTIYTLLRRDANRIDVNSIINIAHALEITADELLEGSYSIQEDISLSELERELIRRYRISNSGIRESVEKLLDIDLSVKRKASFESYNNFGT